MDSLRLSELTALVALRDGPPLLLYLEQGTVVVVAAGRPVALYARFAIDKGDISDSAVMNRITSTDQAYFTEFT